MNPSVIAKRIAEAQSSTSANYARVGDYTFEVSTIKFRDGFRGLSVIAELKVLEARATDPSVPPNAVGSIVSYVEKMDDIKKGGPGRFKAFLCALVGVTEDRMTADLVADFSDESKAPGFGLLVGCEVVPKVLPAKNGQPPKTIESYRWRHLELSDIGFAVLEDRRSAAQLPPLAEVLASVLG